MADKIEEQNQEVEAKHHQSETDTSTNTMSEIEAPQDQEKPSSLESPKKPASFSFSIWPPTQKTRDAVTERLIETLSTPSILSKRYGTVPREDASEVAKRIEEEAFNAAGESASADGSDGIEILQVYSKEVSKRMLEAVKSRSAAAPPPPQESEKLDAPPEEIPAGEGES